jgi:hypothetical protein
LRSSATPVEIGSTVEEPETVIEPAMLAGASLAGAVPLDGALLGAADWPPPDEQAPTAKAATKANAPSRFVVVMVTR